MLARRLTAAFVLGALAVGNAAAAERRPRPTTLYLSTGTAEGGTCTPTHLTTRPTGGSNCGSVSPAGGSQTWTSPGDDEGYPFSSPAGAEVDSGKVTVAINGIQIRSNFIDGSGGSFLKFPPVLADA